MDDAEVFHLTMDDFVRIWKRKARRFLYVDNDEDKLNHLKEM